MEHIKIPREIIYNNWLTEKRIVIFAYLYTRRGMDNTVGFSTTELCEWSGLKPNYRDGKINQKYYTVLSRLNEMGYFKECPDFEYLKNLKSNSTRYRSLKLNAQKMDIQSEFGIIGLEELEQIFKFKEILSNSGIKVPYISSAQVLLVLSYIRFNISHSGRLPHCCYRFYNVIAQELNLTETKVSKAVKVLELLGIIRCKEIPRIKYISDDGSEHFLTSPKVFADAVKYTKSEDGEIIIDETYDCDAEINMQIELFYKERARWTAAKNNDQG